MDDRLVFFNDPNFYPDRWDWWWKSDEPKHGGRPNAYWCTNNEGAGIFHVDTYNNERRQLVGTWAFDVRKVKDPKAKIRRWMMKK